ncbi:MAG TPA: hypothetical protein VKA86_11020 [Candidatus Krumholzibacteria bacterium]|nr:hypothetical protein [Candidatus Krumholzibacteria bacterium]
MTAVHHLMVPGLARRHLDTGWLRVTVDDPPDRRAELVATFPFSIASLEATLLTGRTPREHGRLHVSDHFGGERVDATGAVEHEVDDAIARALLVDGFGSEAERKASVQVNAHIVRLRSSGVPVVITGGPAFARVDRMPALERAAICSGGAMAAVDRAPGPAERAALLATPGVERLLEGDGLRSWHGPDLPAVLVAEPGWSFTEGRAAVGHREIDDDRDAAVVLAWGAGDGPWPAAVHDLRVAPTLARVAGIEDFEATDGPLPWGQP